MINPFYILIAAIRAIILVISLMIVLPIYLLVTLFVENTPKRAFWIRRQWVKFALVVLGISIEVSGKSPDHHALYVCNHRSFSDPVVFARYIDAYVIAKAEVASIPLISKGAEMTGVIYVKREDKSSRSATRQLMVDLLLEEKNVLVYPEGTVNAGFNPLEFKKGTFIEAVKNNIPVVPIALEYKKKKDLWQHSSLVAHHFKQFGRLTTKCKFYIGPPMINEDGVALAAEAEAWTKGKIIEAHKDWKGSYFHESAQAIDTKQA